jgi:cytidylate kinase
MNVVTVTREYGAGGYEVARRVADALGWDLLDRELLHRAAAVEHLPDAELERLDEKAVTLADRFRLHPPHQRYMHGLGEAARQAAARGDVVLVGRGTGQLLADFPNAFHLRLTASRDWRARRMAQKEGWSLEQATARCAEEDRTRERFTRYFFGDAPFQAAAYHLTIHTGWAPLEDAAACVAAVVRDGQDTTNPADSPSPRVLTLCPEVGAGTTGFARTLAARLGLRVYDHELLEQEAARLGVTAAELEKVDERPGGVLQRLRPGGLSQRYFDALGKLMNELASQGDTAIVGRGGNRILRDHPRAFHVRLIAPADVRVRRVMEHRWLRQAAARHVIADSDGQHRRFYEEFFGADWADPQDYHLIVNTGRLGPAAIDLVSFAAWRRWGRASAAAQ